MGQVWEFFSFEMKFRLKSPSTYVYFGLWFFLSFLAIAAEDFLNVGNDNRLPGQTPHASFRAMCGGKCSRSSRLR